MNGKQSAEWTYVGNSTIRSNKVSFNVKDYKEIFVLIRDFYSNSNVSLTFSLMPAILLFGDGNTFYPCTGCSTNGTNNDVGASLVVEKSGISVNWIYVKGTEIVGSNAPNGTFNMWVWVR